MSKKSLKILNPHYHFSAESSHRTAIWIVKTAKKTTSYAKLIPIHQANFITIQRSEES